MTSFVAIGWTHVASAAETGSGPHLALGSQCSQPKEHTKHIGYHMLGRSVGRNCKA